jgi:hypothetical protein
MSDDIGIDDEVLEELYGEDEDLEALAEDLEVDEPVHLDHAFELPEPPDRVAKLESAVKELAGEQVERENKRVRRKVVAATTGSLAAGITPIVLQVAGAVELDPELASAIATVAAALGALLLGYLTPERKAPTSPAQIL